MFLLSFNIVNAQWQQLISINESVYSLASEGSNVYAGVSVFYYDYGIAGGVKMSTNNGNNWTTVNNGIAEHAIVYSIVIDGTNIFAGTAQNGVYLTNSNCSTWTSVNNGLTNTFVKALAISGTNIFAGTNGGLFLSNNNGNNWTPVSNGLSDTTVLSLAVSGTNIFAGTNDGVFSSTNNGTSWTSLNNGLTDTVVRAIAIDGTNIFAGTNGGMYLSTNNGNSWTVINNGLTNTDVRAIAIKGTKIFAATWGGIFLSIDNGSTWTQISGSPQWLLSITVTDSLIFVGTSNHGAWKRSLSELLKIEENNSNTSFIQYPNPSNGKFIINCFDKISSISIYNILGEIIYSDNNLSQQKNKEIDLTKTYKGIYFVKVNNGLQVFTEKIIID